MLALSQLRENFKVNILSWEEKISLNTVHKPEEILPDIYQWGEFLEKTLQEKIRLLENDFKVYPLQGEYLRSVTESFDDLDRVRSHHKTLLDLTRLDNATGILNEVKHHYTQYFIPLVNILSKLENDYKAITTESMLQTEYKIREIDNHLNLLKTEKTKIKNSFFDFKRKTKILKISKQIKVLELQKKILKLNVHHDRLNLYYFNNNRPPELQDLKNKVDYFRTELRQLEEKSHV